MHDTNYSVLTPVHSGVLATKVRAIRDRRRLRRLTEKSAVPVDEVRLLDGLAATEQMTRASTAVYVEATNTSRAYTDDVAAAFSLSRPENPHDTLGLRDSSPRANSAGFVVLSQFAVAHMTDQVKHAFRQRPHHVDDAAGFMHMDVLSPCSAPNVIWLLTYWKDEASYQTWHHSHLYRESHRGIPKGLRLVPKSVAIRFFEHVAS